ncbi:nuclear pore complex protein Nup205 [Episyrphus balteatus]|uniref:nuclear pore complex protein Nup205 n=1 Tax=Episyrphus balteatus TaxID=286459 RepID=UPI0024861887|nr:nuclear pore complex protein Nup205 [Episyrphus balteatus]
MSEAMPEDMWTPYKHLYKVIENSIANPSKLIIPELESVLRKHKQNFTSILRNPPKNENNRTQLRQGITDGINIPGHGHMLLSKDLVDESIIISEMFNLDEFIALELLCTAQRQMPQHPGLPRGLVAILLYYDGRKAIACSLRDLFQASSGVSWCTDAPKEVTYLISSFAQSLVEESSILGRVIELLEQLDISAELSILTKNRALGPPKHRRQVLDLFEDIRLALATALFNWSAQCGLPKNIAKKLMEYLSKYKPTEPTGGIDDVTMTLLMALLYSFDTSVLQRQEDNERSVQNLPIINENGYAQHIYEALQSDNNWEWDNRLKSIVTFGFGLSMASLRHAPQNLQFSSARVIDRDEQLVDEAISMKVFDFIHYYLLDREILFKSEFFYRRVHSLFTDFIDFMHSKVTELRGRADETARTVQGFAKEGLDPPPNLDHNFELLMLSIGKFYDGNKSGLSLSVEYWGPMDIPANYAKTTSRSVSLFKFIRLAGELLPPILFVPYLKMLAGLSSCGQSARNTFNLLKQGSGLSGSATLSWEHFFSSLARYYSNLRQEQCPGSETIYRNRVLNRSINPQEIEGLNAVLCVIRSVATYDEMARVALCEHPNWAPLHVLLGLLSCSVPINLKADILLTLAALGKSKDTAIQLWNNLEASQIIATIPTTNTYVVCGLEVEIEQNESRNETYPLSQAALELFYTLSSTAVPRNLGGGPRKPGLDPYLTFVIDAVLLKFYNRNYKNPAEKWEVGEKCLRLLHYFLKSYEISPADFADNREENAPPGYHIMLQLHTKSDTLRLLLHIIDEARNNLDQYHPFPGKQKLEECALHCLNILELGLSNQDLFFDAHSVANCSTLLSGLNKIMLDVNPRSGKPDHVLNTTKFVTYNSWLPRHALVCVKILNIVSRLPNVSSQILGMFTQNERIQTEIRHGFVESLEADLPTSLPDEVDDDGKNELKIELEMKEAIICLIQDCLPQPAPNIAHFLLGFDITKDIRSTLLQKPGVLDFPSTCTKSLVFLLDNHLETLKSKVECDAAYETIIEKAYGLLYSLCFNHRTSETILRFLRTCNDFLCRHLSALPFGKYERSQVLNQIGSLLRCTAIELKITAANSQITRFQHLCEILLGVSGNSSQENVPLELSHYYTNPLSEVKSSSDKGTKLLICNLLDCLEFEAKTVTHPKWDFFDNSLTAQILQECEIKSENGPKLINIKKLHDILNDELHTVQNTIASGQRQLILKEIESVLLFALKVNEQKNKSFATVKFMEAWGQVTEVLFSCAPLPALPLEVKQELIIEILQCILSKVVPVQVLLELANISSGTVLLLLVNLRYCNIQKSTAQMESDQNDNRHLSTFNGNGKSMSTFSKSNTLSLKFILRNIVEWIIVSGVASQKLRINLYASLLNFMHIVKGNSSESTTVRTDDEHYISRLDRSMFASDDNGLSESNQVQMTVEVFTSFGDKLIDILCHDCIGGHDICKMSALSCIDTLLDLDSLTSFINFIAKRGYLSHLIDSLIKSDESLCRVLRNTPENMRALYVYESKMAMLARVASSHVGAELLLEDKILGVLAGMKVFDMHPDFQINNYSRHKHGDSFVPPIEARYQQILFPALNLCDAIISTLGPENHSAISQIVHFLLSHGDMIEIILRAGTPFLDLGLLQELSSITGLIARTTNQEFLALADPTFNQDVGVHIYRMQRLMLSLLPRFIISEATLKEMQKPENIMYSPTDKNKALQVRYFLETASNLALYCRNAIANHSADHRATGIIFSPSITDSIQRNENRSGTLEISPSLGVVLNQLKSSVEYYNRQKSVFENLQRQRSSLSNIGLDSTARSNYAELSDRLAEKQNELNHCAFITEQCLYLLWTHLDFYMRRTIPVNTLQFNKTASFSSDSFVASSAEASWRVSSEDVSYLKKNLISIFNETFSKQLISTAQTQAVADKGFTEALLRRIKCLIQFVPVN